MAAAGRVLVYGGKGALGSQCVRYFKSRNWVSAGPGGGEAGSPAEGALAPGGTALPREGQPPGEPPAAGQPEALRRAGR